MISCIFASENLDDTFIDSVDNQNLSLGMIVSSLLSE
jgi:hypothetical protein